LTENIHTLSVSTASAILIKVVESKGQYLPILRSSSILSHHMVDPIIGVGIYVTAPRGIRADTTPTVLI
jgi:hypothetical protein